MKTTPILLAALCVPTLLFAQNKKPAPAAKPTAKPAAPATPPAAATPAAPAPGATPAAPSAPPAAAEPELSPAEAKKRLSLALGTFFANRQKSGGSAEKINYESLAKGLSQVLASKDPSFALGAQFAGQMVHDGIDVTASDLAAAFKATMEGGKPLLTQEEVNAEVQKLQTRMNQKRQEAQQKEAAKNEAAGQEFLEKNRTAEGVIVTESGLQYKVLEAAKDAAAPKPTADDTVACNYRGTLLDGTEFDKSPEGKPGTFGLRRVVKGWTEGIPLMQVGSKYRFWVPAALAYGSRQQGALIKPGSALIFDVELVRIEPKTASPTPATAPGQAASPPVKTAPGEKAVATTPPIAVEIIDGKPVVRQVTPEQEAAAKKKAAEAAAKEKPAEAPAKEKPAEVK